MDRATSVETRLHPRQKLVHQQAVSILAYVQDSDDPHTSTSIAEQTINNYSKSTKPYDMSKLGDTKDCLLATCFGCSKPAHGCGIWRSCSKQSNPAAVKAVAQNLIVFRAWKNRRGKNNNGKHTSSGSNSDGPSGSYASMTKKERNVFVAYILDNVNTVQSLRTFLAKTKRRSPHTGCVILSVFVLAAGISDTNDIINISIKQILPRCLLPLGHDGVDSGECP